MAETKLKATDPATDQQLHWIAKYSSWLGMKEPRLEEKKLTFGEAGRTVRLLKLDLQKQRSKKGNTSGKRSSKSKR